MVDEPRLLPHNLSPLEHSEIRDPLDLEARGQPGVLVGVHLEHNSLTRHRPGHALDRRCSSPTWTAPSRPEIHQHGHPGLANDITELSLVDGDWLGTRTQLRLATTTAAVVRKVLRAYTI